jgi:PAS domain S-box-containing protein
MNERKRVLVLILIMTGVSLVVGGVAVSALYRTAIDQTRKQLAETAQSQARLIEAVARFDADFSEDYPKGSEAATLSQIVDAHERYQGFGETGEFTLARREGDRIVFLLSHRHDDLTGPNSVPFASELAEPMRRALSGESGTLIGPDYRGEIVVAAHEPVAQLDWGIVAKIDLAEVRAPFIMAAGAGAASAVVVVLLGAMLFLRISSPLIRDLAARESKLRAVMDTAVEAIITIDRDGIIQSFNRAGERMFGYAADEVIGRNVKILMPSPYHEDHDGYIARYQRTGEARIIGLGREVVARRKDGSVFPIELAVSEITDLQLFTGFIRDISDRKEAEDRLRQADRLSSIGTLAAGLGHDMNNVLLPVRARLDLVEQADLPAHVREQFVEIRKSAKYLQDLADGLHLLALDPDDPDASTATTNLDEWWQQTHTLLGRALPRRVHFSASLPSDLPPICIPPHRLTQAVLNMLVNSAKAVGEDGKVRLWVEADMDNQVVRLGVADNGCGMTEEVKRRALEPFFTTKTRGLGTGLGLSLVHGVVLAAGGTLDIDSEPDKGTTIILKLPAAARHSQDEPSGDVERTLRAVVSVQDKRVESLVVTLVEMVGFDVDMSRTGGCRDASLWVTDAPNGAIATVREHVRRNCHVIILGPVAADWNEPNVIVIHNPNDFDKLRAAITRAAEGASP